MVYSTHLVEVSKTNRSAPIHRFSAKILASLAGAAEKDPLSLYSNESGL